MNKDLFYEAKKNLKIYNNNPEKFIIEQAIFIFTEANDDSTVKLEVLKLLKELQMAEPKGQLSIQPEVLAKALHKSLMEMKVWD